MEKLNPAIGDQGNFHKRSNIRLNGIANHGLNQRGIKGESKANQRGDQRHIKGRIVVNQWYQWLSEIGSGDTDGSVLKGRDHAG
jgi:hypothetical protein